MQPALGGYAELVQLLVEQEGRTPTVECDWHDARGYTGPGVEGALAGGVLPPLGVVALGVLPPLGVEPLGVLAPSRDMTLGAKSPALASFAGRAGNCDCASLGTSDMADSEFKAGGVVPGVGSPGVATPGVVTRGVVGLAGEVPGNRARGLAAALGVDASGGGMGVCGVPGGVI